MSSAKGSTKNSSQLPAFKTRPGGWLPHDRRHTSDWIRKLKNTAARRSDLELVPPIKELEDLVNGDPVLCGNVATMFSEAYFREKCTPLEWQPQVKDFAEFLKLLNVIMTTAPECYVTGSSDDENREWQPAGLIGFPINALLDWPMATNAGYSVFANALVNQQFKKILDYWAQYLGTPASRYVLVANDVCKRSIAWLSPEAKGWIVNLVNKAVGEEANSILGSFEEIFKSDPLDQYYGFSSWDDFFVREFVDGVRPVSSPNDDSVIINACESVPYALKTGVKLSDQFWAHGTSLLAGKHA